MKKLLLGILLSVVGAAFVSGQEQNKAPDWVGKDPYVENGLVYSSGYAKTGGASMSATIAQTRAMSGLLIYLGSNTLPGLPSIPEDAKRSTYTGNDNGRKVEGTFSGVTRVDMFVDDDGGVYVLISCTGVEMNDPQ